MKKTVRILKVLVVVCLITVIFPLRPVAEELTVDYAEYTGVDYRNQGLSEERVKALDTAMRMVTIRWTAQEDFVTWCSRDGEYNEVTSEDGITSEMFLKGKTYTGIPYSMADHSYTEQKWKNAVIQGKLTSAFMTAKFYSHGKDTTAHGTDCSYLIYAAIGEVFGFDNIEYQTTSVMMTSDGYYRKLNGYEELIPGDVLITDQGHVRMYVGRDGEDIATFEETATGSKCKYDVYSEELLKNNGYLAYRCRLFEDQSDIEESYHTPFKVRYYGDQLSVYTDIEGSVKGWIDNGDDCTIHRIYKNGWMNVTYPTPDGTRNRYVKAVDFFHTETNPEDMIAPKYAVTYYDEQRTIQRGYIDPDDLVTVLYRRGDGAFVIYPGTGGRKAAWVAADDLDENAANVKITLSKTAITLKTDEEYILTAVTVPEQSVVWQSQNPEIAEVNDGVVRGKLPGTTIINALAGDAVAECIVTVTERPVESVRINTSAIELTVGESCVLYEEVLPSNAYNKNVTWSSSNTAVAKVLPDGTVLAQSKGTAVITVTTEDGGYTDTCTVTVGDTAPVTENASVKYSALVQDEGWQSYVKDGETAGTFGQSKKLEAIKIEVEGTGYTGNIEYQTHVQKYGWESTWKKNGEISGSLESLRLESMRIRLTGELAEHYDIYYRLHVQKFGWLDWAKNGENSGSSGFSYRVEGIQIKLVEKGKPAPGATTTIFHDATAERYTQINYQTQVQRLGWLETVRNGEMSGTQQQSLHVEGIKMWLSPKGYSGSVEYKTLIQNKGWESAWKKDGELSGTSGEALRLEAIQIRLTDELATKYDIYYRVQAQRYGWMNWMKNGETAGTENQGLRLEAIQIKLVEKGSSAS